MSVLTFSVCTGTPFCDMVMMFKGDAGEGEKGIGFGSTEILRTAKKSISIGGFWFDGPRVDAETEATFEGKSWRGK